jgi:eukaryotic-like serine/threonine-protein kinase
MNQANGNPEGERPIPVCDRGNLPQTVAASHLDADTSVSDASLVLDLRRKSRQPAALVEANAGPPPGTLIGGIYRVLEPLGTGAMGVVLLAQDESLDRRVAIKFIHPELLGSALRERFTAEARAMARVSHPNVLQIYAFGEHGDAPYFVMEVVEGQTIEQWLLECDSVPDLDVALSILDGTCRGVAAIHAADTIHFDIKPSNILLDAKLQPHVADLGVAVICRHHRSGKLETVGTPLYMAPEVALQREVDASLRPRADVYSLGCLAYQLLTGQPPFDGEGQVDVMMQHAIESVPPPSSRRKELPPALDAVILRALAKDPSERTPTAEAFRSELSAARLGNQEPVRILVAEDDDDFRLTLETCLGVEFPDAEIEVCADGQTALEAFDRKRPSVVILDLRMPGLDGMQLTALFRERDVDATIPIIILTASGGPEEWKRLSELGADRFLVKPVILDDVVSFVRRSLQERTTSRPAIPSR